MDENSIDKPSCAVLIRDIFLQYLQYMDLPTTLNLFVTCKTFWNLLTDNDFRPLVEDLIFDQYFAFFKQHYYSPVFWGLIFDEQICYDIHHLYHKKRIYIKEGHKHYEQMMSLAIILTYWGYDIDSDVLSYIFNATKANMISGSEYYRVSNYVTMKIYYLKTIESNHVKISCNLNKLLPLLEKQMIRRRKISMPLQPGNDDISSGVNKC